MKRIPLLVLATLVAVGCQDQGQVAGPIGAPGPFAPEFSVVVFGVTDVGVPLGGDNARAMAVNDLAEVVGISSGTSTLPSIAFHWVNGSVQNLGTLVGHGFSQARDVNSRGQVVGVSGACCGETQAVLWESGTIAALPTADVGVLGEVQGQEANAINDLGQIVGFARVRRDGVVVALVALYWADKATAPVMLDGPAGASSVANDISNRGEIVGMIDGILGFQPAYWASKDAAPEQLQPPAGGDPRGQAFAINDVGQIVGVVRHGSPQCECAVIWPTKSALATALGGSGEVDVAIDINELGQVVGRAFFPRGATAALWIPEPTVSASYTRHVLGASTGFAESEALEINNVGDVVGASFSPSSHATMWSVPIQVALAATPTPIRLNGRGRVTVAILTSPYFNAAGIDPATLTLGNDDGLDTPIARKKKLIPAAKLYDVDRDGDADLVTEFEVSQLLANGDLTPATTRLVLLGMLRNGKHIRGSAAVSVQ